MSTERDTSRIVRSWLQTDEHESAARIVDLVLDRLDTTPQRGPWWRAWVPDFAGATFKFAAAATAAVVVAGIGAAIYLSRPAVGPIGSPSPAPSAVAPTPTVASPNPTTTTSPTAAEEPTPSGSPVGASQGPVAYPVCTTGDQPTACRIWVANPDGTNAHELLQSPRGAQYPLAWSADGSRLLFSFARTGHNGLAWTDATGAAPREFESLCPPEPGVATDHYSCQVPLDHTAIVAISPDGALVAYQVRESWGSGGNEVEATALAILDLSTGAVQRLDSTQTTNPALSDAQLPEEAPPCPTAAWQGYLTSPEWSPDGSHVAFARSEIGPADNSLCKSGLFTVSVATGLVSQVTLSQERYGVPDWSSDGSHLLFEGGDQRADNIDIYTIRPDGTDLTAVTSNRGSLWPHWTHDGRVVFLRQVAGTDAFQIQIVDADGGNAATLAATIPALTAASCVVCPDPTSDNLSELAYWQPMP